ncbi:MAG: hypothetical protein XE01_0354 [Synergistales bacterium 58_81]|nr:MAG: hypothetical protein XD83_0345 [Synergistales bacterium 57_84]KUK88739.1 MAG: hypothetical protein XE01_0354 [Synergistales bacterium 58_81]HCP07508.1 DUF296 domain-containing protein [Synergistaceae bacterium]
MRYSVTEDMAFVRLSDGEELHRSISAACEEYSLDSAIIVGGLGMAREIIFGWYTGKEYIRERFEGTFEVASLSGDVSMREGALYPHVHAVFNGMDHASLGGHVLKVVTFHNLEVFIRPLRSIRLNREFDGWMEAIVPEKR